MENAVEKKPQILTILSKLLPCILGICILGAGITGIVKERQRTENYEMITGYCSAYDYSYTNSKGTDYYRWTYSYLVDGQEYSVTTNFNANFVPAIGSTRTIRYNPRRPGDAYVTGMSIYHVVIFAGIIIIAVAMIGVLNTFLKYSPVDLGGIVKGLAFAILGFGINYFLTGNFSIISTYTTYADVRYIVVFPAAFVAVGIYITVRSLFRKAGNKDTAEEGWIDMKQ